MRPESLLVPSEVPLQDVSWYLASCWVGVWMSTQ